MNPYVEDMLMHYGTPRHSGRYPWGSGENPYQHSGDFLARVQELKNSNFTFTDQKTGQTYTGEVAIAKSMGLSTTQLRTQLRLAKEERRSLEVATAKSLRSDGYSLAEIAEKMGYANDSSIRSLLNEKTEARMNQAKVTAEILKKTVAEKGMLDVGNGVERELGVSKEKLNEALYILELEGYPVYGGGVPQATNPGKQTNLKVLCPPGTEHKEIYNYDKINSVVNYVSHDGGETYDPKWVYPKSMDSKRLKIRYAEEGGIDKDGVVEIRRGVDDLSLGESRYAQVRILVDGTHYIKGMAVYSDNMPDGVDVVFNTNKKQGTPMTKVLKEIKNDPDNPFGSLIKEGIVDPDKADNVKGGQSYYYDKNGEKQLSLINKRAEEGDWGEWANKIPSQFLSKQSEGLIKQQLKMAEQDKVDEYNDICSITNPAIKKKLLYSFAEDCDSAAVHLQAAALPRQQYQVILPITSMKDNEIYAPNYEDGETVALVRYPHGGTFEIPILTVNNKQSDARKTLGTNPKDAVGINSKVAERLSGADFDGDVVMVIPCNSPRTKTVITSTPRLKELEGFDPKLEYGGKPEGTFKILGKQQTQTEMGKISNLICDMTLKGATTDEIARAVKHSMVVIDANKHKLDYKQSEKDNQINSLKAKYQGYYDENGRYHEGAATLISRAKSEVSVPKRRGSPKIDPETGKLVYKTAKDLEYIDPKTGKTTIRTQASTKMAETDDARTLISDYNTKTEQHYASYANKMKALANQARLEIIRTGNIKYSPSANKVYASEVSSLLSKLKVSEKNAPRERQAQVLAKSIVNAKIQANPDMTKAEIKKASQQALTNSRAKVGAKRETIKIDDREWEAIQAGAISENVMNKILKYADTDVLREKATPREKGTLSKAQINKIQAMVASGYSTAQIASSVNASTSTVLKYIK